MATSRKTTKRGTTPRSSAKTRGPGPVKNITIPYRESVDFRQIPSTGALVRATQRDVIITFILDDQVPVSQSGTIKKTDAGGTLYELGDLKEESCRWLQAAVRLPHRDAIALAAILVQQVHAVDPTITESIGFVSAANVTKGASDDG